ncbi:MAG TPA: cupredoxin domain-containing protein [Candidatus Limnocylindrales bacterium]|nr:cupredoxin domain-containing protein [Candidatus Limnocylindrales bacterium]
MADEIPPSGERLPARRPPTEPAPAERFTAPPSTRKFELSPERAAGIVRQSGSARFVGFLAVSVVVLFVILYYFYELGFPGGLSQSRLSAETDAQQVTSIERGQGLFEANCARCHGANGEGGIGPVLNDQSKLFVHLNPQYLHSVLTEGGRYVCGDPKSLMPVWSNDNGGPLNYKQIEDLIAFIRAPKGPEYVVHDPSTLEPLKNPDGSEQTFAGWRDPNYKPDPNATPVPDCWKDAFTNASQAPAASGSPATSAAPGSSPGASGNPAPSGQVGGSPVPATGQVQITAQGIAFTTTDVEAPADKAFPILFDNQDAGTPHNVDIQDASGTSVFKGAIFPGVDQQTYNVPALKAGTYKFVCDVHPNMTGTLTVK